MRLTLLFACSLSILLSVPLDARAQSPEPDRRSVRVAAGLVSQSGIFGDDSPLMSTRTLGPTISVGVRRHPTRLLGLAFDAVLEPAAIENPHFDERVTRVLVQLGPEIGRRVYVRPMAGGSVNLWSGSRSTSTLGLVPAFSLAAGFRHTTPGGARIQPELVARVGVEVGALTWSTGAQLAVSLPSW
jgi:hypothetical protein